MHVELFGATGKTCRHVQKASFAKARKSVLNEARSYSQNGMIRGISLFYRQMYCQVSPPVLFNAEETVAISTSISLVWLMFTHLIWEVLTVLISSVPFILLVILPASGIAIFFGFYLIYPFATLLY